jgi:hypothetical protein
MIHFQILEKQEQAKTKTSKIKEILQLRGEINELETKRQYKGSMK